MVKKMPPTFLRIYLSMVTALVASIFVTIIAVSYFLEQREISDFLEDTDFIHNKVSTSWQAQDISPDDYFGNGPRYLYSYELNWVPSSKETVIGTVPCKNCDLVSKFSGSTVYWMEREDTLLATYPMQKYAGILTIGDPDIVVPHISHQEEHWINDPEDAAMLLLLVVILFVIGCGLYYPAKRLQQQIEALNQTYKAFGLGDLQTRANEDIPQPVKQLATNFNMMANEIAETVKESQVFAQAVPHEMRTPLSRVQLATGLLRKSCHEPLQIELLNNIDTYVDDLDSLTRQVVAYSKLNSEANHDESDEKSNLSLLQFTQSRIAILNHSQEKELQLNIRSEITLECHTVHIRLLLDNLIKNAIRYAKSTVIITACKNSDNLEISVEDDGIGIEQVNYSLVFVPFSRLDSSRNQKTGGLGLGLAIAKAAARKIGGELSVGKSEMGGAKFTLTVHNQ